MPGEVERIQKRRIASCKRCAETSEIPEFSTRPRNFGISRNSRHIVHYYLQRLCMLTTYSWYCFMKNIMLVAGFVIAIAGLFEAQSVQALCRPSVFRAGDPASSSRRHSEAPGSILGAFSGVIGNRHCPECDSLQSNFCFSPE